MNGGILHGSLLLTGLNSLQITQPCGKDTAERAVRANFEPSLSGGDRYKSALPSGLYRA